MFTQQSCSTAAVPLLLLHGHRIFRSVPASLRDLVVCLFRTGVLAAMAAVTLSRCARLPKSRIPSHCLAAMLSSAHIVSQV